MEHLIDIFRHHADNRSRQTITCLTDYENGEQITYADLYDKARYMLYNLRQAGVREGDELVFQFRSDMNFIKTFWACLIGKIIPVPITFSTTLAGVNKIMAIWPVLNNPFIITDHNDYRKTTEVFTGDLAIWQTAIDRMLLFDELNQQKELAELSPIGPDDIAFLQFSSGSTGNPKGVMNTHGAIVANLTDMANALKLSGRDRFFGWMPLTHDFGIIFFHLLPFYLDATQYLMQPMSFIAHPASWVDRMALHRITVSGSPNFGFKYVLDNTRIQSLPGTGLSSLRILLNGAEPISSRICNRFTEYLEPFGLARGVMRPAYGLAEATLVVTAACQPAPVKTFTIDRNKQKIGDSVVFIEKDHPDAVSFVDVGMPIGTEICITDEEGKTMPEDHIGIIRVKGPAVTKAYYNQPAESSRIIDRKGWLDTGDAGFLHQGNLVITGRIKEMIIVHGQNYYPHDLDRVVEELEWARTRQVVSAGVYNEDLCCDEIFFFIVFDGEIESFVPLVNSIRRLIRTRLGLEVGRIIPVKQIPKTTSGKIQRFKLCQDYRQGLYDKELEKLAAVLRSLSTNVFRSGETQLEKSIALVCAEMLGLSQVSLQDNFFDLGYSSLTIAGFREQLEAQLSINVEKVQFYRYPTVKSLAAFIYYSHHPEEAEPVHSRKEVYDSARKKLLNHIRQLRGGKSKTAIE